MKKQYATKNMKENFRYGKIIDCGAYTGDTIKVFKDEKFNFEKIIAYEAEKKNYGEMINNIKKMGLEKMVIAINEGVYSYNGKAIITTDINSGNKLVRGNYKNVESIKLSTIDERMIEDVSLIKMDIEGSELEALKGAVNTIINNRPILAISIYHSIREHIEIPLFLFRILNEYSYELKHHSHRVAETIIYCFPNEKLKDEVKWK